MRLQLPALCREGLCRDPTMKKAMKSTAVKVATKMTAVKKATKTTATKMALLAAQWARPAGSGHCEPANLSRIGDSVRPVPGLKGDGLERLEEQEKQAERQGELLCGLQHRVCKLEKQAERLQQLALSTKAEMQTQSPRPRARQIPKQPVPPPKKLPFPWETRYSPDYNLPRFWNSVTDLSVWERPV